MTTTEGAAASKQKLLDGMRVASVAERLLECAENDEEHARLLSVSTKAGAWLRALPVTALGLQMDDHTVRVYVWEQQSVGPTLANSVGLL